MASKKKPVLETTVPTIVSGDKYGRISFKTSWMANPGRHTITKSLPLITSDASAEICSNFPWNTFPLQSTTSISEAHSRGLVVNSDTNTFPLQSTTSISVAHSWGLVVNSDTWFSSWEDKKPATTCPKFPPPQIVILICSLYFLCHTDCTDDTDFYFLMGTGLFLLEEFMRASFQYASKKTKLLIHSARWISHWWWQKYAKSLFLWILTLTSILSSKEFLLFLRDFIKNYLWIIYLWYLWYLCDLLSDDTDLIRNANDTLFDVIWREIH